MTFTPRTAHDRSDADGRRSDDEAPGLRNDTNSLRNLRKRCAQRRAEAANVLYRLPVVDREPAADVECVEGAQFFLAGGGHELRACLDRFHVLGGVHRLRADMKR